MDSCGNIGETLDALDSLEEKEKKGGGLGGGGGGGEPWIFFDFFQKRETLNISGFQKREILHNS